MSKESVLADPEVIHQIVSKNALRLVGGATAIYGGTCPFCGRERAFVLWADKCIYRCYWCGCDGRFTRSPERNMELKRAAVAKLEQGEHESHLYVRAPRNERSVNHV